MPEGKKNTAPVPAPVRDEDGYSAKTHLHQPVQETATVAATALLADAPEGALPSEVRPEIVTWEKLCEAIQASGKAYNMEMIQKAYELANNAHNGVCRRSGEPYICHPLAVARLVLDLGMDSESIAAALLHDVVEIDAGDTYAYDTDGLKTQKAREDAAKQRIYSLLPDDQKRGLMAVFDEFEADETAEAHFAHAMDNLQPLLLNNSNGGSDWADHDVTAKQVYGRQSRTKKGSAYLYKLTDNILQANIKKGALKEK